MGVYINMEMPTSCAKCKLFGEYGCPFIGAVGYALTRGERNEDCPLVPVPPHGRLIDADALMLIIQEYIEEYSDTDENGWHSGKWCAMKETEMAINDAPTIIPADPAEESA